MDVFRKQLERFQQQLAGMNASQKMLTFLLIGIGLVTIVLWARYAGDPEMEPVLDQAMTSDDVARMTQKLAGRGIQYRVTGGKVYVPADRKFEVLANLGYENALPSNTSAGFDEFVKNIGIFDPPTVTEGKFNKAKEMLLAQVIQNFPGVRTAVVMIDPTSRRSFDNPVMPTATVNIVLRDGAGPTRQLVQAAADVVCGAQAGLSRSRVNVVINGATFPLKDRAEDGISSGDDLLVQRQQNERYFVDKITSMLQPLIPGVMVSVTVDLNATSKRSTERKVDKTNAVPIEEKIRTTNEETTGGATAGGVDPGTGANIGASLATSTGSGAGGTTKEDSDTTTKYDVGHTETVSVTPAGLATVTGVAVCVPRSYFVTVAKNLNPGATEPTDAQIKALIEEQTPKIRESVKKSVGLKTDEDVAVTTFVDVMPMMLAATAPASSSSSSISTGLGLHGKEITLGALALMSLFMVSLMLKKPSAPVVAAPVDDKPRVPQQLGGAEETVGIVGGGEGTLDGMELDEDAVKAQQMLDQVQTMVKENPDAAANLVKRWLNRP